MTRQPSDLVAEKAQPSNPGYSETDHIRHLILARLLENPEAAVSGEDLSRLCGVSRAAIWKHLKSFEEIGFRFFATHGLGYRLTASPDILMGPTLQTYLSPDNELGRYAVWRKTVNSTNVLAAQLLHRGAKHGTVVSAGVQTGGHGRHDRPWFSPNTGLWMSVILRRAVPISRVAELTLVTSVAVKRAILALTGISVQIKWPNDIFYHGKKVCGILAEIKAQGETVDEIVLGIGVNANIPKTEFPEALSPIATSLFAESGCTVDRAHLAAEIFNQLEPMYEALAEDLPAFSVVRPEWEDNNVTLYHPVRVQTPSTIVEGLAESIDDRGVLYVRKRDGSIVSIYSGDVLNPRGD